MGNHSHYYRKKGRGKVIPELTPIPLMAGGINIVYRVIPAVAETIKGLRVVGSLDDGIGSGKSA